MQYADVPVEVIRRGIAQANYDRVFPFRFIAAARYATRFEPDLERALFGVLDNQPRFKGHTVILVDVSGSMDSVMSAKSDMLRMDAACGLAMCLRELCDDVSIFTFSNHHVEVPPRRGFALRDAIVGSQSSSGTDLGGSVHEANKLVHDRLVVISDEQTRTAVEDPKMTGYMINVAAYRNGVGYGKWNHIDGFSEAVLKWMHEYEQLAL
jgi:hypothetical protein